MIEMGKKFHLSEAGPNNLVIYCLCILFYSFDVINTTKRYRRALLFLKMLHVAANAQQYLKSAIIRIGVFVNVIYCVLLRTLFP